MAYLEKITVQATRVTKQDLAIPTRIDKYQTAQLLQSLFLPDFEVIVRFERKKIK